MKFNWLKQMQILSWRTLKSFNCMLEVNSTVLYCFPKILMYLVVYHTFFILHFIHHCSVFGAKIIKVRAQCLICLRSWLSQQHFPCSPFGSNLSNSEPGETGAHRILRTGMDVACTACRFTFAGSGGKPHLAQQRNDELCAEMLLLLSSSVVVDS